MTTGEKIKYFRNMRGISQETLGQLSGINSATIKKYEYGIRNPKPDQLLKIANALGISINIFMDFDIETVSDVLSLLFKLDDQIDMKFEADKDDEGNFKPATVKLSFKNKLINKKLCTYMKALEIRENMLNAKDEYSYCTPFTKESLMYRDIFESFFPQQGKWIKDFWMPNKEWENCDVDDPSARVLKNYGDSGK